MTIMNALLPEHRKVVDIEYMPTEHQGQISDNKEYHYDLCAVMRMVLYT